MLSLAKGVPLVCAGLSEGKNDVNTHVAYHQVGIDLRTEHPRPDVIRQAVDRVSQEPSWRTKAKEVQAEMMALDPAATVEAEIEAMIPSR